MGKNPKILLLGASFNTSNMGVSALADGAAHCVSQTYPNAEIYLLDYAEQPETYLLKTQDGNLRLGMINIVCNKRIFTKNNIGMLLVLALICRLAPSKKVRNWLIAKNQTLAAIQEFDLACSIAGGDSLSDLYGLINFLYIALPQVLVLLAGKKLIMMPQTIGPFQGKAARGISRFILNRAELIYLRGTSDKGCLSDLISNIERKVRYCYDVAFIVEPCQPAGLDIGSELFQGKRALVGINISGLLARRCREGFNRHSSSRRYRDLMVSVITDLIEERNANVLLIPHVLGDSGMDGSDIVISKIIYDSLAARYADRLSMIRSVHSQNELKYIIGQCDFFIGSRMHACIAALSQGIPAVSIAYSDKFADLYETIDAGELVADLRYQTDKEIMDVISNNLSNREEISTELKQQIPLVNTAVLGLFGGIAIDGFDDVRKIPEPEYRDQQEKCKPSK